MLAVELKTHFHFQSWLERARARRSSEYPHVKANVSEHFQRTSGQCADDGVCTSNPPSSRTQSRISRFVRINSTLLSLACSLEMRSTVRLCNPQKIWCSTINPYIKYLSIISKLKLLDFRTPCDGVAWLCHKCAYVFVWNRIALSHRHTITS